MDTATDPATLVRQRILGALADSSATVTAPPSTTFPTYSSPRSAARKALYEHVRGIWEQAKREGIGPGTNTDWAPVALLCDLTADLWANATHAQQTRRSASS